LTRNLSIAKVLVNINNKSLSDFEAFRLSRNLYTALELALKGLREVLEHSVHVEHGGVIGDPEQRHLGHVDWWHGDTKVSTIIAHSLS
jgi:hypothetical protein